MHQYYTQSKARAIAEDQVAHFERLEKAHLELQEKNAKSYDDISQMMEMLKMLTKRKQDAEAPEPPIGTIPLRNIDEETPTAYALTSIAFLFNYGPPQIMKTPGLVLHEPKTGADPVDL